MQKAAVYLCVCVCEGPQRRTGMFRLLGALSCSIADDTRIGRLFL